MKKLLFLLLLVPMAVRGQSFNKEFNEIKHPELKTDLYKSSKRIQTGGGLLAMGGVMLAGGLILSLDADTDRKKTAVKIVAGGGGLFCLIGGIILGRAGEALFRSRNDKNRIVFNGNAVVLTF